MIIQNFCNCIWDDIIFDWKTIIPIIALVVSTIALAINVRFAKKNIKLSIQQAIFKTVSEKVKECNSLWESEPAEEQNDESPHYKVISEIIISTEVIGKSFELFSKHSETIIEVMDDYYYLFWKQLRTDIRGFVRRAPKIAETINDQYYSAQIRTIYSIFQKHFEKIL